MSTRSHGRGWVDYALRRFALAIPTVLVVTVLVFVVFQGLGDPAAIELGRFATPDALARRRAELGLDRPMLVRLWDQLRQLAMLDLGFSRSRGRDVSDAILTGLGPTLAYAAPGLFLGTLLSIGGGLFAAVRPHARSSAAINVTATVLMSTSSVLIVMFSQYLLAHRVPLFPVVGWPLSGSPSPLALHLVLPIIVWVLIQVGPDVRHYRAIFVQEARRPHLDGLRARGVSEFHLRLHLIRGAIAPISARVGLRLPYLVVGSVVIEDVFNIPGLGESVVLAVRSGDLPLLQGMTFVLTLATITSQLLIDLLAAAFDPRARPW